MSGRGARVPPYEVETSLTGRRRRPLGPEPEATRGADKSQVPVPRRQRDGR